MWAYFRLTTIHTTTKNNKSDSQEIANFYDATEDWVAGVKTSSDATVHQTTACSDSFSEFFARPIKIYETTWQVDSPLFNEFDPWTLFFENPRVINRINNYQNLRGSLKLKIALNGNPFYFGRGLVAYRPLRVFDQFTPFYGNDPASYMRASQLMHVQLNPTESLGGTMHLPFIWQLNTMNIPSAVWGLMGEIQMLSYTPLKHAQNGLDPITVSVFAWCEDIELSTPTTDNSAGLVAQSSDEYGDGPISYPASVVSKVAKMLSNIPQIKPYALATDVAATSVGNMARHFGYSKPIVATNISRVRRQMGMLANSDYDDPCDKLTLSAKQAVTVDSRVVGLAGDDEMSVINIAQRESYLTQWLWQTSDPVGEMLGNARVCPWAHNYGNIDTEFQMTPMGHVSEVFKYWRGTIRYRFQVVASCYHKGRIKITYDPSVQTSDELNVAFSRIIDISTTKDFTMDVAWGQPTSFLPVYSIENSPIDQGHSTTQYTATNPYANGIITITVMNQLTTPNPLNVDPITILVSVCAGPDFELAVPTCPGRTSYAPPVGNRQIEVQSEECDPMDDSPSPEGTNQELIASDDYSADIYKVYFGETYPSILPLMKRFVTYRLENFPGEDKMFKVTRQSFPLYRGVMPGAVDDTRNDCNMTFTNWFTPTFLCRRGGMRRKILALDDTKTTTGRMYISNHPTNSQKNFSGAASLTYSPANGFPNSAITLFPSFCAGGTAVFDGDVPLEFEIPHYNNTRFYCAKLQDVTDDALGIPNTDYYMYHVINLDPTTYQTVLEFQAVADDFSLSFYQNVPPVWRTST